MREQNKQIRHTVRVTDLACDNMRALDKRNSM